MRARFVAGPSLIFQKANCSCTSPPPAIGVMHKDMHQNYILRLFATHRGGLLWQLPMLLLVGALYVFFMRLPFCCLDSDAVTFGLMGEDIYKYGHWTTLAYGQNYLFSITPYVYAAFKAILPKTVPWAVILAAAGGLLSLSGLWMIFQSFLSAAKQTQRRSSVATIMFCVLLLGLPKHLFDFGGNASTELGYFSLGLLMWSASKLAEALRAGQAPRSRWWLIAGLAFGYGLFSRPQMCAYGLFPLALLLWQQWRAGGAGKIFFLAGGWTAAGLLTGCLPMLLHGLFRSPSWPFSMELGSQLADAATRRELFTVLIHKVIPALFGFDDRCGPPTFQDNLVLLWVGAALAGYLYFLMWRRTELTPMDHGWFWGPFIVLAVMLTHTHMVIDQSNRRYCLQMVEAMIWLFCRFCVPVRAVVASNRPAAFRTPMTLAISLSLLLLLSSVLSWRDEVTAKLNRNVQGKLVRRDLIPELQKHKAVIIANYWDAYILLFLSEGQLRVEAQPWFWVRTYGRISAAEMQSKTLWLAREGDGHSTSTMLAGELGAPLLEKVKIIPVASKFMNSSCELWSLPDNRAAITLMQKYHPRYFSTVYPPGSG